MAGDEQASKVLEVASAELGSLPSSRAVFVKRGNIFFASDLKTALESTKKELAKTKGATPPRQSGKPGNQ